MNNRTYIKCCNSHCKFCALPKYPLQDSLSISFPIVELGFGVFRQNQNWLQDDFWGVKVVAIENEASVARAISKI